MLVYKYRSNKSPKNRDLKSLINNQIYAPLFEELNDPFEGIFIDELSSLITIIETAAKIDGSEIKENLEDIKKIKNKLGVYSLSKTFKSELLWAHYANAHKGFCIEYNLDKLKDRYRGFCNEILVKYNSKLPILSYTDIESKSFLQKLFGSKSIPWKYEKEIRLLFDNHSFKNYHPSALTGIYFGERMSDYDKNLLITSLAGRDVKFYQMSKARHSYKLVKKLINKNRRVIPNKLPKSSYEIMDTNHNRGAEVFYIYYKSKKKDKKSINNFVKNFKFEHCTRNCYINLFDTNCVKHLVRKFPLNKDEGDLLTSHLINGRPYT